MLGNDFIESSNDRSVSGTAIGFRAIPTGSAKADGFAGSGDGEPVILLQPLHGLALLRRP
jgi:hypothetical protein